MERDHLAVLREVLAEHAPAGPPPTDRVPSVLARARRRRHRSQYGAAVALLIIAGGTVAGAGLISGTATTSHPGGSTATSAAATPTPGSPTQHPLSGLTPPKNPAPERTGTSGDLTGRTWVLSEVQLVGGSSTADRAAVHMPRVPKLTFTADGGYTGSNGCNGIAGTYRLRAGVLTMHGAITTYAVCAGESTNVFHQVTHAAMSVTVTTTGSRLTMTAPNGNTLAFRPEH